MKKYIYIVYGFSGQYEDAEQWNVKAFLDEKNAEIFCKKLNDFLLKNKLNLQSPYEFLKNEQTDNFTHPLDNRCSLSYTGAQYNITKVELSE